ncbi:hypothetical protein [Prochlorothrix hollandica]|uniref:hypothetical protein n=1 Tax=Prochlorothrix hollandica TaxID=1223 RepID=UPI0012B56C4E|nr:hypothetical protein [Prochlorothrix hollandica]
MSQTVSRRSGAESGHQGQRSLSPQPLFPVGTVFQVLRRSGCPPSHRHPRRLLSLD